MVMKIVLRLAIILALGVMLMGSFGCSKLRAKDRLNEGTRAYNKGNYVQAAKLFKESIDLNGEFPQAKLYYAASLRAQYLPGGDSLENKAIGENAVKAYQDVIASSRNPRDVDAAHAFIAELYKGLGQDEEHRNWLLKRIQLPGQSDEVRAQTYYTLASVIGKNPIRSHKNIWCRAVSHLPGKRPENGMQAMLIKPKKY